MKIRKAKKEDKEAVVVFCKSLYGKESPVMVEIMKKNYLIQMKTIFVAEDKGRLLGYLFYVKMPHSLYIADLYILPRYRRRKIATELICQVEKEMRKFKKKYLRVDVLKKDKEAVSLYHKIGFRVFSLKSEKAYILRK